MSRPCLLLTLLLASSCASPAPGRLEGGAPDWPAFEEIEFVTIQTRDDAGEPRDTTLWIVVVDGQGYIRSGAAIRGGGESWVDDLERSPRALIRARDAEFPVTVVVLDDPTQIVRVQDAFRQKYGWMDRFIRWVRPSLTTISRLDPAASSP